MEYFDPYDPRAFQRSIIDVLAAWAVCAMLFVGLLLVPSIKINAVLEEQHGSVMASGDPRKFVAADGPAHKSATACE